MTAEGKGYIEIDLAVPIFRKPMAVRRYIDLLYEALEKRYPESERSQKSNRNNYTDRKRIIRQFEAYLKCEKITKINPDEALLDGFVDHLMATGNGTTTRRRTTDSANRIRAEGKRPGGHLIP